MDEEFGRYRLRGLLGEGGMGRVYRGYDTELRRDVAIKVLSPQASSDPTFEQRFRREAHTAAGLNEPHVVPIFDAGEIDGRLFIAMQLIDGTDVATLLSRNGPMAAGHAVSVIEQAAAALDAAHHAGLVHRDIKPANLVVTRKNFAYLIDFGIAHAPGDTRLTNAGSAIGTVAYMAPERLRTGQIDHRADIYALTCVLYECLTGAAPYPVKGLQQQMLAHLDGTPPRPSRTRPGLPAALDAVIATGMARDPAQRYQTAGELAGAARAALTAAPAVARTAGAAAPQRLSAPVARDTAPPPAHPEPGPRRRRFGVPVAVLLLAAALAAGIAGYWIYDGRRPAYRVTGTIGVPKPVAVGVDPESHTAYIVSGDDNKVVLLDTTTNTTTGAIPVGRNPSAVAVDPTARVAVVSNSADNSVSVIDTAANTVTATVPVGEGPSGVAIDPGTHTAYVANNGGDTVSVIGTTTGTVLAGIPVGTRPYGVAINPGAHRAYITNLDSYAIAVVDTTTNAAVAPINVGKVVRGAAISPSTHTAYIAIRDDSIVAVVDTRTGTATTTIAVGRNPRGAAVDDDTHTAFVTNSGDNTVSVIDTRTNRVTSTIAIGATPVAVTVDPSTHNAYVSNPFDHTVSVIEPRR